MRSGVRMWGLSPGSSSNELGNLLHYSHVRAATRLSSSMYFLSYHRDLGGEGNSNIMREEVTQWFNEWVVDTLLKLPEPQLLHLCMGWLQGSKAFPRKQCSVHHLAMALYTISRPQARGVGSESPGDKAFGTSGMRPQNPNLYQLTHVIGSSNKVWDLFMAKLLACD